VRHGYCPTTVGKSELNHSSCNDLLRINFVHGDAEFFDTVSKLRSECFINLHQKR
jgi:hypothetical protein